MVRFAKTDDQDNVRSLLGKCFNTGWEYLDLFFGKCPKVFVINELNGRIASAASLMRISYISSCGSHPGLYLYALCTDEKFRGLGCAHELISFIKNFASDLGWEFLLVRPAGPELTMFYVEQGFTRKIYRNHSILPSFENPSCITGYDCNTLFLKRHAFFKKDYFQWSNIMLNYIIEEARVNPCDTTGDSLQPFVLLCPLKEGFTTDTRVSVFSYPME